MDSLSPELEQEIQRRVASGEFTSADELVRTALKALDMLHAECDEALEELLSSLHPDRKIAEQILDREIRLGLESESVEMTDAEWDSIRREVEEQIKKKR